MTQEEFLSGIKKQGATFAPATNNQEISLSNMSLQQMCAAMLPAFLIKIYEKTGGINLGNGYIFGPSEYTIGSNFPVPSITEINKSVIKHARMRGKTVFGRNDLFWFAVDSFGTCYMLDNLSLNPLRKYDDPYKALTDCLMAGKN